MPTHQFKQLIVPVPAHVPVARTRGLTWHRPEQRESGTGTGTRAGTINSLGQARIGNSASECPVTGGYNRMPGMPKMPNFPEELSLDEPITGMLLPAIASCQILAFSRKGTRYSAIFSPVSSRISR